jgi:hypothetical protein
LLIFASFLRWSFRGELQSLCKLTLLIGLWRRLAKVAELVDAHDSKSCTFGCEGSIPSFGTDERSKQKSLQIVRPLSSDELAPAVALRERRPLVLHIYYRLCWSISYRGIFIVAYKYSTELLCGTAKRV